MEVFRINYGYILKDKTWQISQDSNISGFEVKLAICKKSFYITVLSLDFPTFINSITKISNFRLNMELVG